MRDFTADKLHSVALSILIYGATELLSLALARRRVQCNCCKGDQISCQYRVEWRPVTVIERQSARY